MDNGSKFAQMRRFPGLTRDSVEYGAAPDQVRGVVPCVAEVTTC